MRKFCFHITLLFFVLLMSLCFPQSIGAHSTGGSSSISVNGELAQVNPYYQGTSSINVPQDILKTSFQPNEQLTFSIDPSKLSLPEALISQAAFRWTFFRGDNFATQIGEVMTGTRITQSFSTPGSYLVNVNLISQGDTELLDTIHVIPYKGYSLPHATVLISQFRNDTTRPILFRSHPLIDIKSSVKKSLWDIGDGKIVEAKEIQHTYETSSFVSFLYHRIIDSQGLSTDVGFQTQSINGKVSFVPFQHTPTAPFTLTVTTVPTAFFSNSVIATIIALLITLVLILCFLTFRMRVVR
jgi:hypothetical protein